MGTVRPIMFCQNARLCRAHHAADFRFSVDFSLERCSSPAFSEICLAMSFPCGMNLESCVAPATTEECVLVTRSIFVFVVIRTVHLGGLTSH